MICDNCMNNPRNNPYASGFCNCALPTIEQGSGWFQGGRTQTEKTFTTSNFTSGTIEITYNNGEKYTACLADSYDNVMACLLDDDSVSVSHGIGKAEEGE